MNDAQSDEMYAVEQAYDGFRWLERLRVRWATDLVDRLDDAFCELVDDDEVPIEIRRSLAERFGCEVGR